MGRIPSSQPYRLLNSLITALLLAGVATSPVAGQAPQRAGERADDVHGRPGACPPRVRGHPVRTASGCSTPSRRRTGRRRNHRSICIWSRMSEGVASSRQMTFTSDSDETEPGWSRDGSFFVFISDREAPDGDDDASQLYVMRPDGGEARRIADTAEDVSDFDFSPDGRWFVYRSGEEGLEQLYRLPLSDLFSAEAERLTDGEAGVEDWAWTPDSTRIYFTRPDRREEDNVLRRDKGFTVDVRNMETPLARLWVLDSSSIETRALTNDLAVSVTAFRVSDDGAWLTFTGGSAQRYERNITGSRLYADQFLLETVTGQVERLTDNFEVGESLPSISPDGRWVAFSAPDDMTRYTMTENRVYLREVAGRGDAFRKLGMDFDGSARVGFWSDDGNTIYFNHGVKVTTQLHALDVRTGNVRQVTHQRAALTVSRDDDSGALLIGYSDPTTPPTVFTVPRVEQIAYRSAWTPLVDANPQVAEFSLGEESEVNWRSTDGTLVGGILVKPVGVPRRVNATRSSSPSTAARPSADVLRFNGGYSAQVYAGAGYAVLKPNYRGSRNYGNAHRTGHRRRLLHPGLRRHHDGRGPFDRRGRRRWQQHGGAGMERRRPLVELDPHPHRPVQGDQFRRRDHELDLDVRPE